MPFLPENALPPALVQPQLDLAAMAVPPWIFSGSILFLCPCKLPRASFTLRAWVCSSDVVVIRQAGVTLQGCR